MHGVFARLAGGCGVFPGTHHRQIGSSFFDKKLTFIPYIKKLKTNCQKALHLLRVVAHTDWGTGRKILLNLYRTIVRSKLDYGCIVYGSARPSYLKTLDTIHHQGIRLALGAFRTSPANSLLVEANEPSLKDRREKLSLQLCIKLKSNRSNPTYNTVFRPNFFSLFEKKPNAIPTFGIRIAPALTTAGIKVRNIKANSVIHTPPWTLNKSEVNFSFTADKKDNTDAFIFKTKFQEITSHYPDFKQIYTDGSKDEPKVAVVCVSRTQTLKCRLPDNASIFSAEKQAINMALDYIEETNQSKVIIFSDSLSVLRSINISKIDNSVIQVIILRLHNMSHSQIIFVGYLATLVLDVMKKPTKQLSRRCRYSHRILNFLTQILNLQLINTFLTNGSLYGIQLSTINFILSNQF